MFKFGEKHPVIFEIILIVAAFIGAAIITVMGSIVYMPPELSAAIGRIAVGIVLIIIYRSIFKGDQFLKNPLLLIPALMFSVWNLFYYLSSGKVIGGMPFFVDGFILAIAPALFEEVIFRGIFIHNLKKKGNSDIKCLFLSAIIFSVVHLTNMVGMSPALVLLQTGYSLVIGLVLAAVYLKNNSLIQVIVAHFLIDFTTHIFTEQPTSSSHLHMVLLGILLVAESVFAVMITVRKPSATGNE
ncbi:MAG: CPBP family intramembrane metalloprotease [Lachnospiraceae bacterium]|nr:CPBP family intramembrane metalloprotease [Lachnospiraceae bacterium]